MDKQSPQRFDHLKDKYGNQYVLVRKSHKKIQFQSSESLIEKSKTLILVKILITKGYGQKFVRKYLNQTSCKLEISDKQFMTLNRKMMKSVVNKIQDFIKVECKTKINPLNQQEIRRQTKRLLRYENTFDTGFQETFVKFIKVTYNLEQTSIYIDQGVALYEKILSLNDRKSKKSRKGKKTNKKQSKSNNKTQESSDVTSDKNSSSSSSDTQSSMSSQDSEGRKNSSKNDKNLNSKCVKSKNKKPGSPFTSKYRKILTLTSTKSDNERIFVAKVLIEKGVGGYMKINELIHQSKLRRQEYPQIHQNDYKKIFSSITIRICRYLQFLLTQNTQKQITQFQYDQLRNLEKYFMNYRLYFVERQREIFENLVRLTFQLKGRVDVDKSQYWPLYIQLASLAVKEVDQIQEPRVVLSKVVIPRPQPKDPRPYEYSFQSGSVKKVNQSLSQYSQSHKKSLQVQKKKGLQGTWYKQNDNQVCILSQDQEVAQPDIQPPRAMRPIPSKQPTNTQLLIKQSYNPQNNFQLSSLINYSNSFQCPDLQGDILNFFVIYQKARKVQDSLNKKYHSQGKRFDIDTINGGMLSLLLKALKILRKQYQDFPEQLPQLTLVLPYQISYMIHVSSYKNCKVQLLNYYKEKTLENLAQKNRSSVHDEKAKRIDDAYFLIQLCNDTLGRMRFEMKRVGERRVQLMIQGKAGQLQLEP